MADPLTDQADEYAAKLKAQYGGTGAGQPAPLGQGAAPGTPYDAQAAEYAQKLQAQYGGERAPVTTTHTSDTMQPGESGGYWGAGMNVLNAMNFGYGPQIAGFGSAVGRGLQDVFSGVPVSTAFHNATDVYYPQTRDIYSTARNSWQQEHPVESAFTSLGGGTVGALLPVGAEAATGNALARTLPAAVMESPTLRWLAGYGGDSAAARLGSKTLLGARQGLENEALQNEPEAQKNYLMAAGVGGLTGGATHGLVTAPYTKGLDMGLDPGVQKNALGLSDLGLNVQGGALSKDLPAPNYSPADLANTTRAINATAGLDSDRLGVEAIQNHKQNVLGPQFEDIIRRSPGARWSEPAGPTGVVGPSLDSDMADIRNRFSNDVNLTRQDPATGAMVPLDSGFDKLNGMARKIENSVDPTTGRISGEQYIALTRSADGQAKGPLAVMARDSNPAVQGYAKEMAQALRNAGDRSAPPGLMDELSTLRRQWKNAQILTQLAPGAEQQGAGFIDPSKLAGPIATRYKGSYAGPLSDISAGAKLLPKPDAQGNVTTPRANSLLGNFVSHHPVGSALGVGGLGYLLSDVGAHYGVPVMEHIVSDFPIESAAGVAGGLGIAALRAAGKKIANSPAYTNMLLGRDTSGTAAMANDLRFMEQAPTSATNALLHSQHRKGNQ